MGGANQVMKQGKLIHVQAASSQGAFLLLLPGDSWSHLLFFFKFSQNLEE